MISFKKLWRTLRITWVWSGAVRFDEEPTSWLGGLPRMPESMEWLRNDRGRPDDFIAQIACADLPAWLWGFLGPRRGWLLLR